MPYILNTEAQQREMLAAIGVRRIRELYADVPAAVLDPPMELPPPLSEGEVLAELRRLSEQNADAAHWAYFLGAGAYNHYSPVMLSHMMRRGEFLTAYTPYQPELSQGTLQWIYEFQTMICQLTGMDVSNAGMYDASTGLAEAMLLAATATRRRNILVSTGVNPEYRAVLHTYAGPHGMDVLERPFDKESEVPGDVACVIVQHPDFFGTLHDLGGVAARVNAAGALFIVVYDPIALGLFKSPGELGADVAIGEGQALGVPMQYGGPYSGLFSAKEKYTRQLPGRLVGMTKDTRDGKRGFVLTLQTREQHIRREKATSNICTNSALMALLNTIYLEMMGPQGLRRVAEICYHRSHYLADRIDKIAGFRVANPAPFFKEFVVQTPAHLPPAAINRRLQEHKIIGGLDVSDQIENGWLLCVTEMNTRAQLDQLADLLEGMVR
jgi:glycine dehydrogenase subunit 1